MKEFSEKEWLLLAYLEGDLNPQEKAKVEAMLAEDTALMSEYRLLAKTQLPVEEIKYSAKASLKKAETPKRIPLMYWVTSGAVAAAIAVLVVFNISGFNKSNGTTAEVEITQEVIKNSTAVAKVEVQTKAIGGANISEEVKPQVSNTIKPQGSENFSLQKEVPYSEAPAEKEQIQFEKQLYSAPLLAAKAIEMPNAEIPQHEIVLDTDVEMPSYMPSTPVEEEQKGWLAKATSKINNKLNHWAGYLQKPKVEIEKEETEGGRAVWVVSLESEKYEWEGRLYTRR